MQIKLLGPYRSIEKNLNIILGVHKRLNKNYIQETKDRTVKTTKYKIIHLHCVQNNLNNIAKSVIVIDVGKINNGWLLVKNSFKI